MPPHHEFEAELAILMVMVGRWLVLVFTRIFLVMVAVIVVTRMLMARRVIGVPVNRSKSPAGDREDRSYQE
ncbi:MAG: hypothetical protein Phyf2KO_09580 [Phycisphaerales bacterium]